MSVVKAVFKRNLASFFGNPAGYVFIILFVGATAWFAFVTPGFFANNQANLNILTMWMPMLLMFFVPSVTMTTWAEEKKLGTDELLFSLPAGDFQVVLGKFLADLAVFTAALLFTFSHVLILFHLGDPDLGQLFATYLGYWLMGAAFIAIGMFASSLTSNITVGFILGLLICAVFAYAQRVSLIFPGRLGQGVNELGAVTHLLSFGRGVVALKDVVYFLSIVAGMLYLNALVLGRRRWPGGTVALPENPKLHALLRIVAVAVILISANVLTSRFGGRLDVTEERLSSLSEATREVLKDLSPEKPVYIQAWISEEVPPYYVQTRDNLLGLLREYDARGGDAVRLKIYRPERFSQEARDAKDKFEIIPIKANLSDEGESVIGEIFMGAAFLCGVEEEVISFFFPGIPLEYELTRTLRVVSEGEQPKVGVIDNELKLFGGFDFQTRMPDRPWQIVEALRKQYNVDNLNADAEIPDDVDVVVAALPSLLKEPGLDNLIKAIRSGKPTLLFMDPLPLANLNLSPRLPRPNPQANPFMGAPPPSEPKCDLNPLLSLLGIRWSKDTIVWDASNPHPQLRGGISPEFIFVTQTGGGRSGFNEEDQVSSGLQELLAFFPGHISKAANPEGNLEFDFLLRTTADSSGTIDWDDCVEPTMFGMQPAVEKLANMPRRRSPTDYTLAAWIRGEVPPLPKEEPEAGEGNEAGNEAGDEAGDEAGNEAGNEAGDAAGDDAGKEEKPADAPAPPDKINVIVVADLDLISNVFFEYRINPNTRWLFEKMSNIPFVLNCVDALAGDDSFISLRKRRRQARVLTTIENLVEAHEQTKLDEANEAEREANEKLAEAQRSFDRQIEALQRRTDMDRRTREIMLATVQNVEKQRLAAKKAVIEEEKNKKVEISRFDMEQKKRNIRVQKKTMAVILPIIPPLIIGVLVFVVRRSRENRGAALSRIVRD